MAPSSAIGNNSCFLFAAIQSKVCHAIRVNQLSKVKHVVDKDVASDVSPSGLDIFINEKSRRVFGLTLKARDKPQYAVIIGRCIDEKQAMNFKEKFKNLHKKSFDDVVEAINSAFVNNSPETAAKVMKFNIVNFFAMYESFHTPDRKPHLILDKVNKRDAPHQPILPEQRPGGSTQKVTSPEVDDDVEQSVAEEENCKFDAEGSESGNAESENSTLFGASASVAGIAVQHTPAAAQLIDEEKKFGDETRQEVLQKGPKHLDNIATGANVCANMTDSGVVSPTSPLTMFGSNNASLTFGQHLHDALARAAARRAISGNSFLYSEEAESSENDRLPVEPSVTFAAAKIRNESESVGPKLAGVIDDSAVPINSAGEEAEPVEEEQGQNEVHGADGGGNENDKPTDLSTAAPEINRTDEQAAVTQPFAENDEVSGSSAGNLHAKVLEPAGVPEAINAVVNVRSEERTSFVASGGFEQTISAEVEDTELATGGQQKTSELGGGEENNSSTDKQDPISVDVQNNSQPPLSNIRTPNGLYADDNEDKSCGDGPEAERKDNAEIPFGDSPSADARMPGETCFLIFLWYSPQHKVTVVESRPLDANFIHNGKIMTVDDVHEMSCSLIPKFCVMHNKRPRVAILLSYMFDAIQAAAVCGQLDSVCEGMVHANPGQPDSWLWSMMVSEARKVTKLSISNDLVISKSPTTQKLPVIGSGVEYLSQTSIQDDDFLGIQKPKNRKRVVDLEEIEQEGTKVGQIRAPMYYRTTNIYEKFVEGEQLFYEGAHKRYYVFAKLSIYDFLLFAVPDAKVAEMIQHENKPASKLAVKKEAQTIAPRVAYQIQYQSEQGMDEQCHCVIVAVYKTVVEKVIRDNMSGIYAQINGNLTVGGSPCFRIHGVRATLFHQYAIDDAEDSFQSTDQEKKKLKVPHRGQVAIAGTRSYQPKAIEYADLNVDELHGCGDAYKAASAGRVAIKGLTTVYVNALKVLVAVESYRKELTNKALPNKAARIKAMNIVGKRLLYLAVRLTIPRAVQAYMTVSKDKPDKNEYGLAPIQIGYLSAVTTVCNGLKKNLNRYINLRNTRLEREDKFPLLELPARSTHLLSRHFIDLRCKLRSTFRPLFDYTVSTNELAEALALIHENPKVDLEACKSQPFTLAQLSRIADTKDSSLEGLDLSTDDEHDNCTSKKMGMNGRFNSDGDDGFTLPKRSKQTQRRSAGRELSSSNINSSSLENVDADGGDENFGTDLPTSGASW